MIILTRLGGHEMALNPDLIERAEPTPDTVITMVDGHKIVVAESLAEVAARVRTWRAGVAAEAFALARGIVPTLAAVEDFEALEELGAEETTGRVAGPLKQARVIRLQRREE